MGGEMIIARQAQYFKSNQKGGLMDVLCPLLISVDSFDDAECLHV